MKKGQEVKFWVVNGLIAAIYIALSVLVAPIASGPVQFRISESLNHLVVFNRKMIWGVISGVVIYNLIWGFGVLDVIFGGGQTLLCLLIMSFFGPRISNIKQRFVLNIALFTISMALIACLIVLTSDKVEAFWPTYGGLALSEFATMAISAPIMYLIDDRVHFAKQIEK